VLGCLLIIPADNGSAAILVLVLIHLIQAALPTNTFFMNTSAADRLKHTVLFYPDCHDKFPFTALEVLTIIWSSITLELN